MVCPVHGQHVTANADDLPLNSDAAPEIERAMREFFGRWDDAIDPLADDIVAALERGAIDLDNLESIAIEVEPRMGEFTNDLEVLFREHGHTAAEAGRAVAGRRHALDIAFDIVPRRTISQLDDWAVTASESVSDTLADEVTSYLRGAHREGAPVQRVAEEFQDEFIDGRVKGWKAEQIARDNTVTPSNAGKHTAHQDASGVIAEEWIATADSRTRASHSAADGQVAPVSQPFLIGGYRAQYPGDPSLPIRLATQCRCTTVPRFADSFTTADQRRLAAGQRL